MSQSARLMSVATAVPPYCIDQRDAAAATHRAFAGRFGDFERLAQVFETAGILRRYAVRPIEWYFEPLGWPERTAAYLDGAVALFIDAATKALDAAGVDAGEVDTVVTVSSTGIATPSLEARVAARMGFRADIERVPVFGLGCAGGVSGLSIASRLAQARPGSVVLLVTVELCTLAFRLDELTKANIVATALFGDGAAACVLRVGEAGIAAVEMSGQHMWPDTLDIMGWTVDPQGFGVIFDRAIPPFAEARMAPAIAGILERGGLRLADIDRFAFHPGGAKVVIALERALSLGQGTLDHERAILAEYGNMSAPTAFFVLERVIQDGLPARTLLTAMGPGFTASSVALTRAA
jgi:alkylresorcinol/alkylpyrone synthase